jgi:hypothetical protein
LFWVFSSKFNDNYTHNHMSELEYYIQQHRLAHGNPKEFRGRSLPAHIDQINHLLREHHCHSILDYGCGKAQCWPPEWQGRITGYDPAYEPHSAPPQGVYDMVICTDVLEHVPESAMAGVIAHIFELRRRWAYISICTRPSRKTLPDGSNKHVTVRPPDWWRQQLEQYDRYTVIYT